MSNLINPNSTNTLAVAPESAAPLAVNAAPLLELRHLNMKFPVKRGLLSRVDGYTQAVNDVSFSLQQGETLGLVGESGCGKTTIGRCIVRAYTPSSGSILYQTRQGTQLDLATLDDKHLYDIRTDIRMIFQDPYSSLNPRMTLYELISEVLRVQGKNSETQIEEKVQTILKKVGLRPEYMHRYPHAFSGGERQRIVIARALITSPRLVVADESVAALDVSVRSQILNLMETLQRDFQLTYLFISHDLSVVRHSCDRVVVMYVGRVVEVANTDDLFKMPKHPYTEALLSAVPIDNPRHRRSRERIRLKGEVADPSNPPSGCFFHPRCQYATEVCKTTPPPLEETATGHTVACHHAKELSLQGVSTMPSMSTY
jgi:peptide/nickel transport system ATP-binding protein